MKCGKRIFLMLLIILMSMSSVSLAAKKNPWLKSLPSDYKNRIPNDIRFNGPVKSVIRKSKRYTWLREFDKDGFLVKSTMYHFSGGATRNKRYMRKTTVRNKKVLTKKGVELHYTRSYYRPDGTAFRKQPLDISITKNLKNNKLVWTKTQTSYRPDMSEARRSIAIIGPLWKMRSRRTEIRGRIITYVYEYDDLGRLISRKNSRGALSRNIYYHYRGDVKRRQIMTCSSECKMSFIERKYLGKPDRHGNYLIILDTKIFGGKPIAKQSKLNPDIAGKYIPLEQYHKDYEKNTKSLRYVKNAITLKIEYY